MPEYEDEESRTLFCGNISDKVTEELLYELFLQVGPVEKVAQPKDKDGRPRAFAFITYVHAVSVPYAVNLFQGTQLFNRELNIKPRSNNNSNVQQRPEHPALQQPFLVRNPFEAISKFSNDGSSRFDRNNREHQPFLGTKFEQSSSSLLSGFNPIPTKASMQMQPQPPKRSSNQKQTSALNVNDLEKLVSMGSNMLQSNSRHTDMPARPTYDMLFTDKEVSARHSNNLKMTSRHSSRSHYRDEPYSRRDLGRDPPRHQQRNSGDRRRR